MQLPPSRSLQAPALSVTRSSVSNFLFVQFALLPITAAFLYKCIIHPRPFWAHFFDPEMIYYMAGRELLTHQWVQNVDNPGTPLQIFSALIQWILGSDPHTVEHFRYAAYGVTWSLICLASFLLVSTVLAPLSRKLQAVAIWTWFLCPTSLEYMSVWSPESLYFPAGALALAMTAEAFRNDRLLRCLYAGMAVGLCCAVKFTFLAWAPALLVPLFFDFQPGTPFSRRTLRCGVALFGVMLGFIFATLPVYDHYGQMFSWLFRLASRSGQYGSDAHASLPGIDMVVRLLRTLTTRRIWCLWLVFCVSTSVWSVCRSSAELERRRPAKRLVLFAILAIALTYGMAIRSPSPHYLLPSGLCTLVLFAVAAQFSNWTSQRLRAGLLSVGMFLLLGRAMWMDIELHLKRINASRTQHEAIAAKLQELTRGSDHTSCVVYTFPAPVPSLALRVMSADAAWKEAVGVMYPHEGHQTFAGEIDLTGTVCQSWDFCVVHQGVYERSRKRAASLAPKLGPEVAEVAGFRIYRPPVSARQSPAHE